jgi:hypothetical protein
MCRQQIPLALAQPTRTYRKRTIRSTSNILPDTWRRVTGQSGEAATLSMEGFITEPCTKSSLSKKRSLRRLKKSGVLHMFSA